MRFLCIIILVSLFGSTIAQSNKIVATKKNRTIEFYEGKKYKIYFYKDSAKLEKGKKGIFTILTDSTLVITSKKAIDTVSISQITQIHKYKSFVNIMGGIGEIALGGLLLKAVDNTVDKSFTDYLLGAVGTIYIIDGFATIFGWQTVGVLGENPTIYRKFTFAIKRN